MQDLLNPELPNLEKQQGTLPLLKVTAQGGNLLDGNKQLERLMRGNERYVEDRLEHPNRDADRRRETAQFGQSPIVATLSCSDSRAPIEVVFDKGVGDIFSVRTAGNIIDELVLGSLELGISQFDIPLLCVLGHTNCGAIKLAVEVNRLSGNMSRIVHGILPVFERVTRKHPQLSKEKLIEKVTEENVRSVIREIRDKSEIIDERAILGDLLIIGGVIDIESGLARWLD